MKKSLGAKTVIYPTPVLAVGTYDAQGKPNVMIVAWGGVCCSDPPAVAISVRKATYTYGNLVARKAFTLGIPGENCFKEADFLGMVSGRDTDKFAKTGLTAAASDVVDAPYVAEFPVLLECRVIKIVEIGLHTQFIGEILDAKVDESMLGKDGLPDVEQIKPILFAPEAWLYYRTGKLLGRAFSAGKSL